MRRFIGPTRQRIEATPSEGSRITRSWKIALLAFHLMKQQFRPNAGILSSLRCFARPRACGQYRSTFPDDARDLPIPFSIRPWRRGRFSAPFRNDVSSRSSWACVTVPVWRSSRMAGIASSIKRNPSERPGKKSALGKGAFIRDRQDSASAIKWPARFPLSTVETYRGSRGRRSPVSYQL